MRLLLVEDDPMLARQLAERLAGEGYAVDTAADGEEAAFLGAAEPYDAIVLDLGLPLRDGLSVLRGWRADGRSSHRCGLRNHVGLLGCNRRVLGDANLLFAFADLKFGNSRFLDQINQFFEFAQIHEFFSFLFSQWGKQPADEHGSLPQV